jgi:hypothetical protein
VADAFVVSSVGGPVATRLFVADAGMQTVVLTNDLGVTNLLRLNTRQEIEIPLK